MYFNDEYENYEVNFYDDYSVSQRRFGGYCATYVNVSHPNIKKRVCYQGHQKIRTQFRDNTGIYQLRRVRFVYDCRDCYSPGSYIPGRPPMRPPGRPPMRPPGRPTPYPSEYEEFMD